MLTKLGAAEICGGLIAISFPQSLGQETKEQRLHGSSRPNWRLCACRRGPGSCPTASRELPDVVACPLGVRAGFLRGSTDHLGQVAVAKLAEMRRQAHLVSVGL